MSSAAAAAGRTGSWLRFRVRGAPERWWLEEESRTLSREERAHRSANAWEDWGPGQLEIVSQEPKALEEDEEHKLWNPQSPIVPGGGGVYVDLTPREDLDGIFDGRSLSLGEAIVYATEEGFTCSRLFLILLPRITDQAAGPKRREVVADYLERGLRGVEKPKAPKSLPF